MSMFSQRYGYSEDQGIQYERVGKRLRNRLWNNFFAAEYDADPFWIQYKSKVSLLANAIGVFLFIISQQPYAAVFVFAFLIIKALMLIKR